MIFGPKIFWIENICVSEKYFGSKQNLGLKKFGPKTFWSTKIMNPKKLGPNSLVQIRPVTVDILLIWTNVASAYMFPGQMFGQNWVSFKCI